MFEFDAAVREVSDGLRVCDNKNRVPRGMQLAQYVQDRGLVVFIEISCRLIRKNQFRMIDQRACDGHALLFAARKLRGKMFQAVFQANAAQVRKNNKSLILLWMGGGPSHMDTWDLKPESEKNGGPFKPVDTSATGVKISEHLPNVARQMKHLSIIRSLDSKEGNHDRGTYMMHTGYAPNPTVVHPNSAP